MTRNGWLVLIGVVAAVVAVLAWKLGSGTAATAVLAGGGGAAEGVRRKYQRRADVLRASAREQPAVDAAADARVEASAERARDRVIESSSGEEFDPDEPPMPGLNG